MTLTDEELLRGALNGVDAHRDTTPPPVERVVARGRALRVRRRRVWTGTAVSVLAGVVGVVAAVPGLTPSHTRPAATVAVPRVPTAAPSFAPVRVLQPGEHFEVGAGYVFTMYADRADIKRPTGATTVVDMRPSKHRPAESVDRPAISAYVMERPDVDGLLLLGGVVYLGHTPAAGAVIDLDGRIYVASVVTLPGTPGWSVFYVPPSKSADREHYRFATVSTVTVYAADGSVITRATAGVPRSPAPGETVPEPDPADFSGGPPPWTPGSPNLSASPTRATR
ncbi:hypothetical protein [Yinghuangia seranimata]|uniref:hypothetical protein n=1 Tax=Yinghuangia seranimata TaxID=408067 RepID=UPI00248B1ADF|nr:hypothetical protein [Yinghuangia seranimata]MDI2125542.1 hypothetical protein [Yinghuangia seranimata]